MMANCSDCFNFGNCLQHEGTKYYGLDAACNNVEELCENFKNKADFVEVVRCKECEHSLAVLGESLVSGTTNHYFCNALFMGVSGNFFCPYGKNKDVSKMEITTERKD